MLANLRLAFLFKDVANRGKLYEKGRLWYNRSRVKKHKRGENMTKKINLGIISLITFIIVFSNFSYGIFTPNIYQSDDKKILAYAELSAATVTLASGQRIHATNVNGDT